MNYFSIEDLGMLYKRRSSKQYSVRRKVKAKPRKVGKRSKRMRKPRPGTNLTFVTSWCGKSNVGEEYPFGVSFDPRGAEIVVGRVIKVPKRTFDRAAYTLEDLPLYLQRANPFVITDGQRYLAIDTQGFTYPRYKGVVVLNGEKLPLW